MINVLIVEDNSAYRESLYRLLREHFPFMQVTEAAEGMGALHQALARRFDLIFMDIRLPHGNGLDLTRALKAVLGETWICVITSHDLPEYRDAAFRSGADRFVVKGGATGKEMIAMIESLLQQRFKTLVVVADAMARRQLTTLLSIRWPGMIVVDAENADVAMELATALKPDLVVLDLALPDTAVADLLRGAREAGSNTHFVGLMPDEHATLRRAHPLYRGVDYFVSAGPQGHTDLAVIIHGLQQGPLHH